MFFILHFLDKKLVVQVNFFRAVETVNHLLTTFCLASVRESKHRPFSHLHLALHPHPVKKMHYQLNNGQSASGLLSPTALVTHLRQLLCSRHCNKYLNSFWSENITGRICIYIILKRSNLSYWVNQKIRIKYSARKVTILPGRPGLPSSPALPWNRTRLNWENVRNTAFRENI